MESDGAATKASSNNNVFSVFATDSKKAAPLEQGRTPANNDARKGFRLSFSIAG